MLTWLRKLFGWRDGDAVAYRPAAPAPDAPYVRPQPTEAESLAELDAFINRLVAGGFDPPEAILAAAEDYLGDDLDPRRIQMESGPMLERALAAHARAEASWPQFTDCDRLDAAFAALERTGIVARQNFSCCGTCGSTEIWDEMDGARDAGMPVRGYAFYHMQDTERAVDGDGLYLNYGAVEDGEAAALAIGRAIVEGIEAHGLRTDWNGSWSQRIAVSLDWKRRRGVAPVSGSVTLH